jgi:hypothetical protein
MEQALRSTGAMLQTMMMANGALSKDFYAKYGKSSLPLITDVMSQHGAEIGKMMQKAMPVKDMNDVAERFKMMSSILAGAMEVVESSGNMFRIKLSRCPLGIEETSRELCEALMSLDVNMIGSALGQEVEMKILKSVAVGDKACEIVYTIK